MPYILRMKYPKIINGFINSLIYMDYKEHTKLRFKERFNKELSDDDYYKICDICKSSDVYFKQNTYKKAIKMIIKYDSNYIWCVVSHKKKIIKTVYPVQRRIKRKLTLI